ncbi:DUF1272 domain-containing protein [Sphingomonas sp. LaA6.9]|uniref:DUF1272 domain-containing protein n=1 Tax=Sphingomonas sp. LaA6.9 TaxID=2919914 RepID=UPI001F4FF6B6|nr:DUF1272 domain-containing protein [Sphingomonas sp. LaA6.9]MCJ8158398.1 DUF1272 domain-containing protein [Sphingomonas sp. LaA6.9]
MLEMRPDCERCGADLPPGAVNATICSFECTFCTECARGPLAGNCPNCGGELLPRPTRAEHLLEKYPPSTTRRFSR